MKTALLSIAAAGAITLTVVTASLLLDTQPPAYQPPPVTTETRNTPMIPPGYNAHPRVRSWDGLHPDSSGPNGTWLPQPYDWFAPENTNQFGEPLL